MGPELKRSKDWYRKRKEKGFKKYIKEFRRKTIKIIEELQILQNREWYTLKEYEKICRDFTELTIKHESVNVENRSFSMINIDHIMPIKYGWRHYMSPYLLAMNTNLQRLYVKDNIDKGSQYTLLTA